MHRGYGETSPKPLRGEGGSSSLFLDRLAAPELLFDLLDLVLAHSEVVSELVNHGFGDAVADLVLGLARLLSRLLVDRIAIRQIVAEAPAALGQGSALVE